MPLSLDCRIDEDTMLGFLGVPSGGFLEGAERADQEDYDLRGYAHHVALDCEGACSVRGIWKAFPLGTDGDGALIAIGAGLKLPGADIKAHLKGANSIALSAVTLGFPSEAWLKRARFESMAYSLLCDAAASALVEAGADKLEMVIREDVMREGRFLGPRFSPGYGDLPLEVQGPLLDALDARQELGIYLNPESLMIPAKSVTAIAGIFDSKQEANGSCSVCYRSGSCEFLSNGTTCY